MKNLSLKLNWMSIVMLVSLGINFFVIGFLYAQHKANEIRMTRLFFDNQISKLVEPFPRKGKRDFYVTMRSKRDELIPIYQNIMQQRSAIMTIIAEDEFDAEKLRSALQDYHNVYHALVTPSQDVMIGVISEMSLEERQAILERFNNPPRRDRRGRGDNDRRRGSNDRDGANDDDSNDSGDNGRYWW